MYGHQDRCDRTAYVAGLQPTISDIELFEVFNKVAHVEKVIVRNSSTRHALVVFKSVEGLYMALVHFQGVMLHGRQLHIRPLRESSHNSASELSTVQTMHDPRNRRPSSVQEKFHPANMYTYNHSNNNNNNKFSYARNPSSRRRSSFNRSCQPQQNQHVDIFFSPQHQFSTFKNEIQFEDHSEGAKRFDSLANLIRGHHPANPYTGKSSQCLETSKSRSNSAKESSKPPPPTWKMELQIKKENEVLQSPAVTQVFRENPEQAEKMTAQELLAKFSNSGAGKENVDTSADNGRKKRPNLSVINPSLFYEQYPRTSSPLGFINSEVSDKVASPHDPAVLAYRRARAPTTIADLSPIDIQNCSFVTKHFAENNKVARTTNQQGNLQALLQNGREMTNDELSDMIVSTGNLRIDLPFSMAGAQFSDEPAPWSPVKRVRAESGSLSLMHVNSPQFSPIKAESTEFEDDVFCSENSAKDEESSRISATANVKLEKRNNVLVEPKRMSYEDITNSRLPSNCHSANPMSEKRTFVFPDYSPFCRHVSVPSLTNFVSDMSDFGIGLHSQHVSIAEKLIGNTSEENSGSFRETDEQIKSSLKAEII